ncbi:scyllo-inositol 2-dehydrogenase (NADP+) [Pseudarthrobacter defluvii]|uniref:Gfo/Idh/MocA family protein n=1 Tax=Pseudarthrobacter defluvii TaxID=410837 RepID=UPI002780E621|nr:Gfo/Idh/MocA family oxidoreductase [Pseudarthrobacter defluvii]MDQ0771217.1 scyllo-inositol 2-dehydrogenase (NADP+) [Pseudarthrobacter defluvii]
MRTVTAAPIRTAVVGFGVSGKVFHAPLVAANTDYSLDVIVTAQPERAAEAARLYPQARIVATSEELFTLSVDLDLVILGTPPHSHFALAATAIAHGLHVVVDKPFVPTSALGEELVNRAYDGGVQLTVFQNRRWDADFLTLQKVLASGVLGQVSSFESRFEWWRPEGFGNWRDTVSLSEGGGILHDLGAHLIDQAIQLFGPVERSYGETANRGPHPDAADTEAFVSLLHASGVRSRLWMNGMAAQVGARFHVLGSQAGYTKWGLDGQEPALAAGTLPSDQAYGVDPQESWGLLGVDGATSAIPAERGAYPQFYVQLAAALRGEGPLPVDPADPLEVLKVIEGIHALA